VDARTDRQRAYEERFAALIGLRLSGVTYCEIDYEGDYGWDRSRAVGHLLDFGLALQFEGGKAYSLSWDQEFEPYGLQMNAGPASSLVLPTANARFVDASSEAEWRPYLGREISELEVYWYRSTEPPNEGVHSYSSYPQDLSVGFTGLPSIYLGAYEYNADKDSLWGMTDNLLVVFSDDVARRYQVGPHDDRLLSSGKITGPAPNAPL